jgi:hypothetical protein
VLARNLELLRAQGCKSRLQKVDRTLQLGQRQQHCFLSRIEMVSEVAIEGSNPIELLSVAL